MDWLELFIYYSFHLRELNRIFCRLQISHKLKVFFTAIIMWVGKWGEPFFKKTFGSMYAASFLRDEWTGICSEVQFILKYISVGVCSAFFPQAPRKIIDMKILILMISKGTCHKRQGSLEFVLLWKYSDIRFLLAILFYSLQEAIYLYQGDIDAYKRKNFYFKTANILLWCKIFT